MEKFGNTINHIPQDIAEHQHGKQDKHKPKEGIAYRIKQIICRRAEGYIIFNNMDNNRKKPPETNEYSD